MSELSFLLDLLLNEKLSKSMKDRITERLKEVELTYLAYAAKSAIDNQIPVKYGVLEELRSKQAPSTQKILDEMAMHPVVVEPPQPSTAAAAQALNARAEAIRIATSGKPEPGRTSPRKF